MLGWWFDDPEKWVVGEWREREGGGRFGSDYPGGFRSCATIPEALYYGVNTLVAQMEHGGCVSDGIRRAVAASAEPLCTESCRARLVVAWHWRLEDSMSLALNAADLYLNLCAQDNPKYPHVSRALDAANDLLRNPSDSLARETRALARDMMCYYPMGYYVAAAAVYVVDKSHVGVTVCAKEAALCCARSLPREDVCAALHKRVLTRLMLREPIGVGDVSVG